MEGWGGRREKEKVSERAGREMRRDQDVIKKGPRKYQDGAEKRPKRDHKKGAKKVPRRYQEGTRTVPESGVSMRSKRSLLVLPNASNLVVAAVREPGSVADLPLQARSSILPVLDTAQRARRNMGHVL